ncbi:LCP family protein [Streptococcus ovuberis]|uniref:Regulatory protein MsrR n=1 Tax=Streptococcus ovuberis TaxID=1936207 RepID=A0A7X6N088_9STRE|nr:LCP family protein [Streptococcus ovuberis]NKZ21126.1 LCP family protein [Streptococcus ovuberis]
MAKDYENLTHHESLRYDYLQKNIHFLGDRDRAELHYLEAKIAGKLSNHQAPPPKTSSKYQSLPPLSEKGSIAPKKRGVTSEGLPVFDRSVMPSSQRITADQSTRQVNSDSEGDRPAQERPMHTRQHPSLSVGELKHSSEALPQLTSRSERRKMTQKAVATPSPKQILKNIQTDKARRGRRLRQKSSKNSSGWGKRLLTGFGIVLLLTLFGMLLMFLKGYYDVKQHEGTATAAEVEFFDGQDTRDGINILVLGTDSRIGQASTEARTDSIMVVNIGNSDGKIKIVSFMRDTLINIPEVSQEDGINTYYDQKLNTAFSIGEQNDKQGAEAIRIALKSHFDIDIKYYVMIDFQTFATAIDTIFPKGVKIDARFATVDGEAVDQVQVPDDLNAANGIFPEQTIEIGEQYMDGRTLLNYARFRKDDSGDFGRTERQQQVLAAILNQVKNPTKLFTGSAALGKIMGMTSTNLPYSFILSKGLPVLSDAANGIAQTTIPENGDWVDEYDMYGGLGLAIDFEKYQQRLFELGLR